MKKKIFLLLLLFVFIFGLFALNSVYVTPSGKRYHLRDCHTIKNSKTILELSVSEAKARGYTPCQVCKP